MKLQEIKEKYNINPEFLDDIRSYGRLVARTAKEDVNEICFSKSVEFAIKEAEFISRDPNQLNIFDENNIQNKDNQ